MLSSITPTAPASNRDIAANTAISGGLDGLFAALMAGQVAIEPAAPAADLPRPGKTLPVSLPASVEVLAEVAIQPDQSADEAPVAVVDAVVMPLLACALLAPVQQPVALPTEAADPIPATMTPKTENPVSVREPGIPAPITGIAKDQPEQPVELPQVIVPAAAISKFIQALLPSVAAPANEPECSFPTQNADQLPVAKPMAAVATAQPVIAKLRARSAVAEITSSAPEQPVAVARGKSVELTVQTAPTVALVTAEPTLDQPSQTPTRPIEAQRPIDFGTLVDRLVAARDAAGPQPVKLDLDHAEFGRVTVRFDRDETGLLVALASPDPEFARSAAAALPVAAPNAVPAERQLDNADRQPPSRQDPATSQSDTRSGERGTSRQPDRRAADQFTRRDDRQAPGDARRSGIFA